MPRRRTREQIELAATAELVHLIAERMPAARAHVALELSAVDGCPGGGERIGGRGTAELTPTEAAASVRFALTSHLDDIDAGLILLKLTAADVLRSIDATLGIRAPAPPEAYCSTGTGRDGAHLPWTPYGRDLGNGWADPTCKDLATPGRGGLCEACSKREDAWRRRNGLSARSHVQPLEGSAA